MRLDEAVARIKAAFSPAATADDVDAADAAVAELERRAGILNWRKPGTAPFGVPVWVYCNTNAGGQIVKAVRDAGWVYGWRYDNKALSGVRGWAPLSEIRAPK